tara:strand:+ start:507 stop:971 length:465 start_codon:yes stop_codon:yes gene_type:complete
MQGNVDVIKGLNELLTGQLSAINQYFLHARMLSDWGYEKVAKKVYKASIHQMKEAQKVTDRILFLEGLPNYQKLLKLEIGENTLEALENDKNCSNKACLDLRRVTQLCLDAKDHASRELVEHILEEEEEYLDWIETQLSAIGDIGIENYLAEQI